MLKVGDTATDLQVTDQHGKSFRLSELWQKGGLVLFFYPKDETGGCTKEVCSFRDSYEEFTSRGVDVVGVSHDSPTSHQKFANHYRLPFRLVDDPTGKLHQQYDVKARFGWLRERITYVIDREGRIRMSFNNLVLATWHVSKALDALKTI